MAQCGHPARCDPNPLSEVSTVTYTDPVAADLNVGFVVAIKIVAKEGEADAVANILKQLIAPTMAEAGVKFFMPYRSPTDPSSFFIYELYIDDEGWEAHNNSAHFKAAIVELLPRCASRERVPFVPYV
jgi:quinol monooxygenase YgiN